MTEEEKEAIKFFYNLRATIDESNMLFDEEIEVKHGKETIKQITTILNLIEKLQKENEELKQDRNNNYQMIALAQNEALGYMQGYEDGKKLKRSAVANIVENQQYYIFNKQIEHYKEYIEKLLKENELLRTEVNSLKKENEELNEKILDNAGIYQLGFKDGEESYIKKVKDKIRKNEEIIDISNDGDLIHELYQKNKVYEELLESEK